MTSAVRRWLAAGVLLLIFPGAGHSQNAGMAGQGDKGAIEGSAIRPVGRVTGEARPAPSGGTVAGIGGPTAAAAAGAAGMAATSAGSADARGGPAAPLRLAQTTDLRGAQATDPRGAQATEPRTQKPPAKPAMTPVRSAPAATASADPGPAGGVAAGPAAGSARTAAPGASPGSGRGTAQSAAPPPANPPGTGARGAPGRGQSPGNQKAGGPPGHTGAGQAAAGPGAPSQGAASQGAAGQGPSGQSAMGQSAAGKAAAGQAAPGQTTAGQAATGQTTTGQTTTGQTAAGQTATGQTATDQAVATQPPTGQASEPQSGTDQAASQPQPGSDAASSQTAATDGAASAASGDAANAQPPAQASLSAADLAGQPVADGPMALMPRRVAMPAGVSGSVIIVPFTQGTGAAMFTRGGSTYIVFDERRPIDLRRLGSDRMFTDAAVRLMPAATVLQLRLASNWAVTLSRTPLGWQIAILGLAPRLQPIIPAVAERRLVLPAENTGQVVTIMDPDTGATLLVGTQTRGGQAVLTPRRSAEFALLATQQGVVAEPLSDRVALRVQPSGFMLVGEPDGLLLSPSAGTDGFLADAAALTRRFQFPSMPPGALQSHLTAQLGEIAAVPTQARAPRRVAAARSMIALGLAAEGQAMLGLAAGQAPAEGLSAELAGLSGVAALLAGRPDEANGLADPRLSGTDEVAMWRAIRSATRGENAAQAAAVLAATAKLALTYPPVMRDKVVPLMAETMIAGGATRPAAALIEQAKDNPRIGFARAMLLEAQGDKPGALAAYNEIARGRDQRDAARAAVRAVELRLASGELDGRKAAEQLDRLFYAWRGDAVEPALRERVATLRQEAGDWRAALTARREIETDFPEAGPAARAKLQETFAAFLKGDGADKLAPLDLISLVDENADLLPATAEGAALHARLADRLLALDLPKRADPTIEKLIRTGQPGAGRATLGERLAGMRLREGNAAGALAALEMSDGAGLPNDLVERRTLIGARANAKLGNVNTATASLARLGTAEADAARATILEGAQDWPAAKQALSAYAAKTVPASGALDDAQRRTLLRLATAASRAGDNDLLADLHSQQVARMGTGPLADMFRLLTADPVRASADLPRAATEAKLVRAIPAGIQAVGNNRP